MLNMKYVAGNLAKKTPHGSALGGVSIYIYIYCMYIYVRIHINDAQATSRAFPLASSPFGPGGWKLDTKSVWVAMPYKDSH